VGGMKVGERANAELTGDTLEGARSFLELLRAERVIDTQTYRRRLGQISCAVGRHGHYWMESSELEHACRVAWRQSSRCIGRLPWKRLVVRDCRELVTPEEIFGACVDHLRLATNGGRIRPVMSVFAADRDQLHAMTTPAEGIWVRASYQPGSVRGGPDRSPGRLRARCTKHHAGTHRNEIESLRSPRSRGVMNGPEGRFPSARSSYGLTPINRYTVPRNSPVGAQSTAPKPRTMAVSPRNMLLRRHRERGLRRMSLG